MARLLLLALCCCCCCVAALVGATPVAHHGGSEHDHGDFVPAFGLAGDFMTSEEGSGEGNGQPQCPENMRYDECGSACAATCVDPRPSWYRLCTKQCVHGCFCIPPYVMLDARTCLMPDDCPKLTPLPVPAPELYEPTGGEDSELDDEERYAAVDLDDDDDDDEFDNNFVIADHPSHSHGGSH